MRYDVGGPIHPTRSYFGVDGALGLPALYAGVKLLSDNAASMPLRVYQNLNGNSSVNGGTDHTHWNGPTIFDKPSVLLRTGKWISTLMTSVLLQGNAWGFITGRDGYGFPTGIEWIPPQDVTRHRARGPHVVEPAVGSGVLLWPSGAVVRPGFGDVPHQGHAYRGPGRGNLPAARVRADDPEARPRGLALRRRLVPVRRGFPPGTFQNAEIEINDEQAAEIRAKLVNSLRRREAASSHGRDWDYKAPSRCRSSEAQFINAMQLNATQIAAVLNLPPDRIGGTRGDSLTYNTVVQASLEIIESLRPWLVRMEQAFFELLPRNRFAKFYTDELLKTDLQSRMEIYEVQRNIGVRTANEIRRELDMEELGESRRRNAAAHHDERHAGHPCRRHPQVSS